LAQIEGDTKDANLARRKSLDPTVQWTGGARPTGRNRIALARHILRDKSG
jgi:hypothetical protein